MRGYTVLMAGIAIAPRGLGTMAAMLLGGRIANKVDTRLILGAGLLITAWSLHSMARFNLDTTLWTFLFNGFVQGFGFGWIFLPMNLVSFSTLKPEHRNDGTAMFSLTRNIGASLGISILMTLLAQKTQINHAVLAEHVTPFREALDPRLLPAPWDWRTSEGMQALNREVGRQARLLAFLFDFRAMMWLTLAAVPLAFLARSRPPGEETRAAAE